MTDARAVGGRWATARRLIAAFLSDRRQFSRPTLPRDCPICGHRGRFVSVGHPPRWDARCPRCGSRERHRLLYLWITEGGGNRLAGKRILHVAPERAVRDLMRGQPLYETADLHQKGVNHAIDLTRIALPDDSYDIVIANHVLEHVADDRRAMEEIHRILKPGGLAVLSVPINASRETTWEDGAVTDAAGRHAHFSAADHLRYYGLDFAARLEAAGFTTERFRLGPEDEVRYGLLRDEWLTLARKPAR